MRCTITTKSTEAQAEAFLPLTAVKQGIRIRHSHEDARIRRMRNNAITKAENYARIAILQKTVRVVVRGFSWRGDEFGVSAGWMDVDRVRHGVKLPLPLVSSITSVNGINDDNSKTAIASDVYVLEDGKRLVWKKELPKFRQYEIIYVTGYAAASENIELDALREAIIEAVQDAYDNPGEAQTLPPSVRTSLAPFFNSPLTK